MPCKVAFLNGASQVARYIQTHISEQNGAKDVMLSHGSSCDNITQNPVAATH